MTLSWTSVGFVLNSEKHSLVCPNPWGRWEDGNLAFFNRVAIHGVAFSSSVRILGEEGNLAFFNRVAIHGVAFSSSVRIPGEEGIWEIGNRNTGAFFLGLPFPRLSDSLGKKELGNRKQEYGSGRSDLKPDDQHPVSSIQHHYHVETAAHTSTVLSASSIEYPASSIRARRPTQARLTHYSLLITHYSLRITYYDQKLPRSVSTTTFARP